MAFFVTGAVIAGGAGLLSAGIGAYASGKAADKQAQAANNALNFQKQTYDTSQANFKPYMDVGKGATYTLGQLTGTGGNGQDFSSFYKDPSYQFAQQQGELGIERGANARGMNLSGGTLKDLASFNSGLASQQYGNYFNRLMGLSQLGQASAAGSASNATTAGGQIGNSMQGVGQAQASGIVGGTNAITGGLNSGTQNALLAGYLGKNASGYGNISGNSNAVGSGTDAQYNQWARSNGFSESDLTG
jgi:hypothetical protein